MNQTPDVSEHGDGIGVEEIKRERAFESNIMRVVGNHLQMEIEMFVMVVLGSDNELHIAGTSQILKFLDKSVLENLFLNALKAWTISIQDSRGRPIFEVRQPTDGGKNHADGLESAVVPASKGLLKKPDKTKSRQMAPRDSTYSLPLRQALTYPVVPGSMDNNFEVPSDDDVSARPVRQMQAFRIREAPKVYAFLASRLRLLQQLADKKIAKAWIKGICPKKQSRFPYHTKARENDAVGRLSVPKWWPNPHTICRFIEPDHIKLEERVALCVHILQLRPTPARLQKWNEGAGEPNLTHRTRGWTAFLQELAPLDILKDIQPTSSQLVNRRQELLTQMYEVAEKEEDFLNDRGDGDEIFQWYDEEDEDRKVRSMQKKRVMTPSTPAKRQRVSQSAAHSHLKNWRDEHKVAMTANENGNTSQGQLVEASGSHGYTYPDGHEAGMISTASYSDLKGEYSGNVPEMSLIPYPAGQMDPNTLMEHLRFRSFAGQNRDELIKEEVMTPSYNAQNQSSWYNLGPVAPQWHGLDIPVSIDCSPQVHPYAVMGPQMLQHPLPGQANFDFTFTPGSSKITPFDHGGTTVHSGLPTPSPDSLFLCGGPVPPMPPMHAHHMFLPEENQFPTPEQALSSAIPGTVVPSEVFMHPSSRPASMATPPPTPNLVDPEMMGGSNQIFMPGQATSFPYLRSWNNRAFTAPPISNHMDPEVVEGSNELFKPGQATSFPYLKSWNNRGFTGHSSGVGGGQPT